jgi:peptidyl-prolyl cis-trans isomerase C
MTKLTISLIFAGLIASGSLAMAENTNTVLAVVNGKEITIDQVKYLDRKGTIDFDNLTPQQKKELLESLINQQLVLEQLRKEGFDQADHIVAEVKALTETYIIKQYMVKVALGFDFSEETLKANYEEKYLNKLEQYRIRHILLTTEDEAVVLISELKDGADFLSLAEQQSQDKISAKKGGDLGWLTSEDMVPSFYKTVSALTKGDISLRPTKTQFGWHIIRLDDKHVVTPPAFSEVKKSIRQQLIKEKMNNYFNSLRAKAKIEIK